MTTDRFFKLTENLYPKQYVWNDTYHSIVFSWYTCCFPTTFFTLAGCAGQATSKSNEGWSE